MSVRQELAASVLTDLLFEEPGVGRCLVAPDGTILRVNAEWLRSTGFTAEQVIGEDLIELFPETRDMALAMHARARAGHTVQVPRHAQRVGGRETWWDGSIAPVPMDGGTGLLISARELASDFQLTNERHAELDRAKERRAEQALLESEASARRRAAELQVVLDAVPAAVFITRDRDAAHMEANRFCAEMLRMPLGSNVSKSAPEGETPRTFRALKDGAEIPPDQLPIQIAAATGREVRSYEFDLAFADGEVRHMFGNAEPLIEPDGAVRGAVGAFLDITERKQIEDALRQAVERYERQVRLFDGVASTTPDFVYLFDLQGRFLYANRRLLEVWGMQLPDVIGKTCHELGYEQWHHDMHMREIAQVIETKRPIKGEVPFKAPLTGVFGVYEYIFTPVIGPNGDVEIIAGTTRDVTERKSVEDALREADRRKSEFLAVLSHELRNPLAPIRNSIHLMERAPPGSDVAGRALVVLRRQADHLAHLVDDLLDITRITHGKIELQVARIDARDVVRRAWEDARALFDQRAVELLLAQAGEPLWVDADGARLSQMVGNLLNNALKFTPPGGQVRVRVDRRGGACEVSVSDDGLGIDAGDLERIFDPFVQAERTQPGLGGMGIGLALVRDLAGRMGGRVRAESAGPGKGAEFIIQLPLAAPPPRAAAPAHGDERGPELSVLIVEDNEDAAATLADLLALGGHRVATAGTGRDGVDAVAAHPPDVLICDVGLPDMSGHDLIRAVRSCAPRPSVFAIALTGYAQPRDRDAALAAGFDAHLPKPLPLEELDALLRDAARRKG